MARNTGQKIREYREAAQMKQGHLARAIGRSSPYLSRIERGTRPVNSKEAAAMRAAIKGYTLGKRDGEGA